MDNIFTQERLQELYNTYLLVFPTETERIKLFTDFIDRTPSNRLYTRKNFDGHVTTSAFIVNRHTKELLLLRHKTLERWLQPGGHFENDASLMHSALREAEEETGILQHHLVNIPVAADIHVPFDIDPHYIPPNPRKEEDSHYHHDVRYLFAWNGNSDIAMNEEESTGLRWVPFSELENDDTFGKMIVKINQYL